MNYKAILKLESNGLIIEGGTNFDTFKISELEGLSGLDFDFIMETSPNTANYNINGAKPLPREITFRIYCSGDYRQALSRFFNPQNLGKLTCTWGNTTHWIEYYPYPVTIIQETVHRRLLVDIKLICPNPYWNDMSDYGKNIAAKQPLLAFPFVMLRDRGLISDYKLLNTEVEINNTGDVAVGARIIFKALGAAKNPRLTLGNGKYVSAIVDMVRGDELIFNTDSNDLYVTLNGKDVYFTTPAGQEYFQVPTGKNTIKYSADEGTSNLNVFFYFTPQYIGM